MRISDWSSDLCSSDLLSRDVEMVVVPDSEGYFGVLPRHAPMISTLSAGVIDIYQGGAVVDRIFVDGSFAEVTEARCTVLAEEAVTLRSEERREGKECVRRCRSRG